MTRILSSRRRGARTALTFVSGAALVLCISVGTVMAWVQPSLVANCAPDENSYAWTINLAQEADYNIQFSWSSTFSNPWSTDFGSQGPHSFTTIRGGATLYARWLSDGNSKTQGNANGDLCEQPTPTPTPTPTPKQDHASLNIKKVDENGRPLAGAVFKVDGIEGRFKTGEDGKVCITGLPADTEYLVTEVKAPDGYLLADPNSQMVEVDDDGDCNSADAKFVNLPIPTPTPTPTPTPSESQSASQSASATPSTPSSPEQSVEAATGTPAPLPDTATGEPIQAIDAGPRLRSAPRRAARSPAWSWSAAETTDRRPSLTLADGPAEAGPSPCLPQRRDAGRKTQPNPPSSLWSGAARRAAVQTECARRQLRQPVGAAEQEPGAAEVDRVVALLLTRRLEHERGPTQAGVAQKGAEAGVTDASRTEVLVAVCAGAARASSSRSGAPGGADRDR